jgi:AraC-like DNA-binding protein
MKQLSAIALFLHRKRLLFILPLLLGALSFLWTQSRKSFVIFPDSKNRYRVHTYSDTSDSNKDGKSVISTPVVSGAGLTYDYTLKKGDPYPYAGLYVNLMPGSVFLDISRFDYVLLELDAQKAQTVDVYLKAFVDGFTTLGQENTQELLMKEITADSTFSRYKISLNELIHPSWWLEDNKIAESKLGKPHFSKLISMQLQNGISTPFDTPIQITIKKIAFVHKTGLTMLMIVVGLLLYFFAYMLAFLVIQRKIKAQQKVISYKELEVENDADKDVQRIMSAVAKHYADPEFTVEKLAREAGVSASRIPGMLKERFNMNFKQYLNIIRITEAKRLLRETDNQITTCAYNVGYNNIPHFNRTFKQLEGISPKEYRKKLEKPHA